MYSSLSITNRPTQDLLKEATYRVITEDPTNKQKNRLILLLRKIKNEGGNSEEKYKFMYPTGAGISNFMGSQSP